MCVLAAMEAVLQERVAVSLQQHMLPNAIFLCERLCAGFPTEVRTNLRNPKVSASHLS